MWRSPGGVQQKTDTLFPSVERCLVVPASLARKYYPEMKRPATPSLILAIFGLITLSLGLVTGTSSDDTGTSSDDTRELRELRIQVRDLEALNVSYRAQLNTYRTTSTTRPTPTTTPATQQQPRKHLWEYEQEVDPMTDQVDLRATLIADTSEEFEWYPPRLILLCLNSQVDPGFLILLTGFSTTMDPTTDSYTGWATELSLRIDSEPVQELTLPQTLDALSPTIVLTDSLSRSSQNGRWLSRMLQSDQLLIEEHQSPNEIHKFDLRGMAAATTDVLRPCQRMPEQ